MTTCKGRHHVWTKPAPGGVCRKCAAPWRGPGRPRGPSGKMQAGEAVAGRLAATLGVAAPPALSTSAPAAAAAHETAAAGAPIPSQAGSAPSGGSPAAPAPSGEVVPAKKGWCRRAGRLFAKLFVLANEFAAEELSARSRRFRFDLNDPDDDDVDDMAEGAGEQLAIWFKDSELSPWKKCAIAAAGISAEMWVGARERKTPAELAAEAKEREAGPAAPAAAPGTSAPDAALTSAPTLRPV